MRKSRFIAVIIFAILFFFGAFSGLSGKFSDFENTVHIFLNPNNNTSAIMRFFTEIGQAYGVIAVIALFLVIPKTRKKAGLPLAVGLTASCLASLIIKNLVTRQRPAERLLTVSGYSFPSGHAMNNTALYIGIFLLFCPYLHKKYQKVLLFVFCFFMTAIICISRIYFNVHYFTDVFCGFCLGFIAAIIISELHFKFAGEKNDGT